MMHSLDNLLLFDLLHFFYLPKQKQSDGFVFLCSRRMFFFPEFFFSCVILYLLHFASSDSFGLGSSEFVIYGF